MAHSVCRTALLLLILVASVHCHTFLSSSVDLTKLGSNVEGCKTICQRFGMEVLAKEDSRFKGIDNPIPCSKKCEEVFQGTPSLVQLAVSHVDASKVGGSLEGCKTICQRFGMKALAAADSRFNGITSPGPCCNKCAEVFEDGTSLAEASASSSVSSAGSDMTKLGGSAEGCQTICQRFGMSALAAADSRFEGITSPGPCCSKCAEVFAEKGNSLVDVHRTDLVAGSGGVRGSACAGSE